MTAPPPGAQISEDGFYWWNENTGDPNAPGRWELLDTPGQFASAAQGAAQAAGQGATQGAAAAASTSQADPAPNSSTPEPNSSQQSNMGDVSLDWEYSANDDLGIALDELVASGWEPASEDETA